MQAARMGHWKAVRPKPDAKLELFNLKSDPLEQTDVSARNPDVLARMEALIRNARVPPRPQKDPPQDFVRRL